MGPATGEGAALGRQPPAGGSLARGLARRAARRPTVEPNFGRQGIHRFHQQRCNRRDRATTITLANITFTLGQKVTARVQLATGMRALVGTSTEGTRAKGHFCAYSNWARAAHPVAARLR